MFDLSCRVGCQRTLTIFDSIAFSGTNHATCCFVSFAFCREVIVANGMPVWVLFSGTICLCSYHIANCPSGSFSAQVEGEHKKAQSAGSGCESGVSEHRVRSARSCRMVRTAPPIELPLRPDFEVLVTKGYQAHRPSMVGVNPLRC